MEFADTFDAKFGPDNSMNSIACVNIWEQQNTNKAMAIFALTTAVPLTHTHPFVTCAPD